MQHESTQILPLLSSGTGAGRSAAVANNAIRLIDCFGRSPRGDEIRYQACECNRIGGGEHSDAPL
jgi:hypothetical protein